MADYEHLAALRGPKLSDLPQHVHDALVIALPEPEQYQVGQVQLAAYQFVPYALSGMAAAMRTPATGLRASTEVSIPLGDDAGGSRTVSRQVTLYGPGDVVGVDPAQIIRRYPSPGSSNAEETFHAHIEFDRPELPWAFSAQTPASRMRPWLTLVCLEADEPEWEPATGATHAVLSVDSDLLPDLEQAWGWAHAQAAAGPASTSARLSTAHAPANLARLLAARVLTQNTSYVAALVPTTNAGVAAGLGLPAPATLELAWRRGTGIVRLPVYDRWEFRTAPDGDFPRLARRLKGVPAPWRIGRRIMDTARPGAPLSDLAADEPGRRQVIRCALFSPNAAPPGSPSDTAAWSSQRTARLREAVERPAVLEGRSPTDPGQPPNLPIVGPRLYAQGQRGARTLPAGLPDGAVPPTGDWFADLNLSPVNRVVAGLGTRVVVKDQEPLMQAAWAQVGEIDKANRALALAQLSQALAARLHARVQRVDPGRLLGLTRPVAGRVKLDGAGLTVLGQAHRSATPAAALGGGFRKAVRPAGRVGRYAAPQVRARLARAVAPDGPARDFSRPYRLPDGIRGLSAVALESLDAGAVARVYQQPAVEAMALLTRHTEMVAAATPMATQLATPSTWQAPAPGFDAAAAVGRLVTDRVSSALRNAGDDLVRTRWLGGIAAGLAATGDEATRTSMTRLTVTLHDRLSARIPAPLVPGPVVPGPVVPGPVVVGPVVPGPGPIIPGPGPIIHGPIGPGPVLPGRFDVPVRPGPVNPIRRGAARAPVGGGAADERRERPVDGLAWPRWDAPIRIPVDRLTTWVPARPRPGTQLTPAEKIGDLLTPAGTATEAIVDAAARLDVSVLRAQITTTLEVSSALALAGTPTRDRLMIRADELVARLDPRRTVVEATRARVRVDLDRVSSWLVEELIRPIMAAPRFDRAMYRALDDYNREWLVPGLGTLPEPELVTVLEANDQFVEAFLVGLSDEMARELLWRLYPTDCRGTYFHRFWDASRDELRAEIHRFTRTGLGSHVGLGPIAQSGRAVVVVRGEVVRRYPDLTIMAMKSLPNGAGGATTDDQGRPFLPESPNQGTVARTLFVAPLEPDIMLAGLDLTVAELRKPDWWIVLSEHPQAPRFRRAEPDLVGQQVRFADPRALPDGGAVAKDRLENPNRIAWEAAIFLDNTSG